MTEEEHKEIELEEVNEENISTETKQNSQQKLFTKFNIKNSQEKIVKDFYCSLNLKIPHNGTMFVTTHFLLFSCKFPSKEQAKIQIKDIKNIEKKNTLKVIANAIKITTHSGKEYLFGSFIHRDDAFNCITLQIRAVEEEDEFLRDQEKKKTAERSDAMLHQYKTLNKINAEEIIESLEPKKKKEKKCLCTII